MPRWLDGLQLPAILRAKPRSWQNKAPHGKLLAARSLLQVSTHPRIETAR